MKARHNFELVHVIAIIAALVAIMLPFVHLARDWPESRANFWWVVAESVFWLVLTVSAFLFMRWFDRHTEKNRIQYPENPSKESLDEQ